MTLTSPRSWFPSKPVLPDGVGMPCALSGRLLLAAWLLLSLSGGALAGGDGFFCPGERERALKLRQDIVREWPLRSSADEATQFVQDLGVRLAEQYGGRGRGIPWRFALVRNLAPNAFSIGAGYVFVTEGAVTFAENEAELAAILAHEIGHELAGHFCEAAGSAGAGGFFDIFFSDLPAPVEPHEVAGVGSLRQTIDPVKEQQADEIAVSILKAAGYDPNAMLQVARRLPAGGGAHLLDPARIASLQRLLARLPPQGEPHDSEQFQAIKRMLVSESPRH